MVYAVITIYNPSLDRLQDCVLSLGGQVSTILLVDNSSSPQDLKFIIAKGLEVGLIIEYTYNENVGGIAGAQNVGIKKFLESGDQFLLFLDQDSVPSNDMVSKLLLSYHDLSEVYKVACLGPLEGVSPDQTSKFRIVSEIKSSGTLFHRNIFDIVGVMEDKLFIDAVDSEWCWRAASHGFLSFEITNALMDHRYGEGDRKVWGATIRIPAAFRTYYQVRNYIFMLGRSYVPFKWKARNGIKYLLKFFIYPVLLQDFCYVKFMLLGLIHGIANKSDKFTIIK